ncbi:hypothetical protein M427DRAFT_59697 [Gonapodya prolifera JEL478]|uniref:Hyaluronan/mRNA-binding protein domain-containing protein n=1 Tax=Gonapodya prolifera (strain JEL478) TaxID=1344416 RepID=A0A139A5W1_GONPJ|nr:hypothetical protein M427DRAFT_59697 [Gonapodya prolifera JEL478]|eukprot:KXS12167.1 hypothetical protein M427DRAFT_59697 [Gonapodya prolifera JEL478]
MTAVMTTNPFALLDDDDDGAQVVAAPKPAAKAAAAAPAPAPAKQESRADKAPREDRPRRGGYGRRGAGGADNRDRNVPPRLARQENGEVREGGNFGDRENGRGGFRGRGRGFPKTDRGRDVRGGYRGRGRQFDRHSATGRVDSDKQEATGGWGAVGSETDGVPVESPVDLAPAESNTEQAAAPVEPEEPVEKTAEQLAREEELRKEEEERKKEEEALAKQKTLEQYIAERDAQRASLESVAKEDRALNAGVDPNLLKSSKKFERKAEEDIFFAGKTKATGAKPAEARTKEQKQVVDIDFRFTEEPRRGRGRGDRPASSGRGRGAQGGRGRGDRGGVNVADASAFPSLK